MTEKPDSPSITRFMTRRHLLYGAGTLGLGLGLTLSSREMLVPPTPMEVTWDMLIPPGVPYADIIGAGVMDEQNDIWKPEYDSNATKFNDTLEGAYIRMPGYVVPLDLTSTGTSTFILVPYVGACIHTPPPPPNQLVYTTIDPAWQMDDPWNAIWVTGTLTTNLQSTDIADTGYVLAADNIELFTW